MFWSGGLEEVMLSSWDWKARRVEYIRLCEVSFLMLNIKVLLSKAIVRVGLNVLRSKPVGQCTSCFFVAISKTEWLLSLGQGM